MWPPFLTPVMAFALCAISGVFNAVGSAVPWTLLSLTIDEDEVGLFCGILNCAQVTAQLLSSLIASAITEKIGFYGIYGKDAPGIATGAIYYALAIPVVFFLIIPERKEKIENIQTTIDSWQQSEIDW